MSDQLLDRVPDVEATVADDWELAARSCVAAVEGVAAAALGRAGALVVVTNEVGLGIVPGARASRCYRDALGLVNQVFAAAADEAYPMVSGLPERLR